MRVIFVLLLFVGFNKSNGGQTICDGMEILELLHNQAIPIISPMLAIHGRLSKSCWIQTVQWLYKAETAIKFFHPNKTMFRDLKDIHGTIVFAIDSREDLQNLLDNIALEHVATKGNIVIIVRDVAVEQMKGISIGIAFDQNVFVINSESQEMFETYNINNVTIWNIVGQFISTSFEQNLEWSPLRSNLYGKHLIGITEHAPPSQYIDPHVSTTAQYFENNQTYDVTNHISGLYYEIFKEMASDMNFTFSLYKRKDSVWGTVVNGKLTGMLRNLADESVDLVVADYGINTIREPFSNPLPVLTPYYTSVAIKKNPTEEFSVETFTSPFQWTVWITIVSMAFIHAIWFHWLTSSENRNSIPTFCGWFWTALSAYFGGNSDDIAIERTNLSNRIVLLTYFLFGFVTWMFYQASLTSILATVKLGLPFDSLETLLESDFTLGTYIHGSTEADIFTNAKPGSVHEKLFQQKMHPEDSFTPVVPGLKMVLDKDKHAYFDYESIIIAESNLHGYGCMFTLAWKSRIPTLYASMATPKNSSLHYILSRQILKMKVSGRLQFLRARFVKREQYCNPIYNEYTPMSLKKLITPFGIVGLGFVLAMALSALEITCQCSNERLEEEDLVDLMCDQELTEAFEVVMRYISSRTDSKALLNMPTEDLLQKFVTAYETLN